MDKELQLDIIAPDKIIYQGKVQTVSAPGEMGGFQILYNHAPLLSTLSIGEIKFTDIEGETGYFATSGGFVEVRSNRILFLIDTAERSDEIDKQRAEKARQRALERIKERNPDTDFERAQLALYRAINRLKVSERPPL